MKDVAGRIVAHIAQFADVPIAQGEADVVWGKIGREQRHARLGQRPGEVVAVVVEVDVGVLRGIEAALLAVAHGGQQPGGDLFGDAAKILAAQALKAVQVVAQQLGVVVEHLLEVRNAPALVHAVAMKAAGELVVDAAAGHVLEGGAEGHVPQGLKPRFILVHLRHD